MKPARKEFERLAVEQIDMVYRVARRLVRDAAKAEDLVQETYLRAFRARETFNLESYGIRPWLLRILHNVHLSHGQRDSRQPLPIDEEQLELAGRINADPATPFADSFDGMDQRLARAVESLPEEYRIVLLLWAVEDLAYKEIADALEIPIGTVMSRLHRARQRLGEQLRDYAVEEGIIRE